MSLFYVLTFWLFSFFYHFCIDVYTLIYKVVKKTILLFILILQGAVSASAQLYRYLDTNQGLSSRRVIAIEKDTKGYMWFLTHEGVDRYNGKQFTHYPLLDKNKSIQQPPNLSHLQVDETGNIWVIGKNGYRSYYWW